MVVEEMLVWAAETGCVLQLGATAVSSGSSAGLTEGKGAGEMAQSQGTALTESRHTISRADIFLPLKQRNRFKKVDCLV